jgi:hypothetical protein
MLFQGNVLKADLTDRTTCCLLKESDLEVVVSFCFGGQMNNRRIFDVHIGVKKAYVVIHTHRKKS